MAVFSEGGVTHPDVTVGVSCSLLLLICTILNTLVLLHNYHKKSSVPRNLFLCLSITDLITPWILLLPLIVQVFKKTEVECEENGVMSCNEVYFNTQIRATWYNKLHSILVGLAILAPYHYTSALALARYFQMKYPFRQLRSRNVLLGVFLSLAYFLVAMGCFYFNPDSANSLYFAKFQSAIVADRFSLFGLMISQKQFLLAVNAVTLTFELSAMIASILTIYELVKSRLTPEAGGPPNRKTRSTLRILITNFGSLIAIVSVAFAGTGDGGVHHKGVRILVTTLVLPCFMSTFNPFVYILFTSGCTLKLKLRPQ